MLHQSLRYKVDGYFYSDKFQNNQWDGYKECYSILTHRFRSGLIHRVAQLLHGVGYQVRIDNYHTLELKKEPKSLGYLREWQEEAIPITLL